MNVVTYPYDCIICTGTSWQCDFGIAVVFAYSAFEQCSCCMQVTMETTISNWNESLWCCIQVTMETTISNWNESLWCCMQVTMETTISNWNESLWQYVQPLNTVFEPIRSMVANRLATSGGEWVEIFSQFNSGT